MIILRDKDKGEIRRVIERYAKASGIDILKLISYMQTKCVEMGQEEILELLCDIKLEIIYKNN